MNFLFKEYKDIAAKAGLIILLLYIPHFIKNMIVSLFTLESYINMPAELRVFNKIVAFKIFIVITVFFIMYNREYLLKLKFSKLDKSHLFKFVALAYLAMLWYYGSQILIISNQLFTGLLPWFIVGTQFLALAIYLVSIVYGVLGKKFLKDIYKNTFPQTYYLIGFFIIGTIALWQFEKAWFIFSEIIGIFLYLLMSQFYDVLYFPDPYGPLLQIKDLAVQVGAPCSGIDSMFLFVAFFLGLFALDHKRIKTMRFVVLAALGFIGVFFVNILRLTILLLVGVYISPEFAVGLFHTNAGWTFFVLYFLAYYWLIKRWVYKN